MLITSVAKKLIDITDSMTLGRAIAQVMDFRGLSKDLVKALTDRAVKQKDVIIDVMAKEFSSFLAKINIAEEAQKILQGMTLDVQASINFKDQNKKSKSASIKMDSFKKKPATKKNKSRQVAKKKRLKRRVTKTKKRF